MRINQIALTRAMLCPIQRKTIEHCFAASALDQREEPRLGQWVEGYSDAACGDSSRDSDAALGDLGDSDVAVD